MEQQRPVLTLEWLERYARSSPPLLKAHHHPTLPLTIWNYTEYVQYKKLWDPVTNAARGLVTEAGTGKVVARAFPKFHDIQECRHQATPSFRVEEKVDGSMGLLFYYASSWHLTTRGSFTSTQAAQGKQLLDRLYDVSALDPHISYVFEIVTPATRVVIDYKGKEALVFLTAFQKDGSEVEITDAVLAKAGFPQVKRYEYNDLEALPSLNWRNAEGFVVRFTNGQRVKVKFERYLELHRATTGCNKTTIWKWFMEGKGLKEILEDIPDEYYSYLQTTWGDMEKAYSTLEASARVQMEELKQSCPDKKSLAVEMANRGFSNEDRSAVLAMYDNRPEVFRRLLGMRIKPPTGRQRH